MADVFLSYAGQDRTAVAALAGALELGGWTVWWDHALRGGDEFAGVIQQQLDDARCVVVAWSQWAAQSGWVAAEGQRAFDARKVVTVRLDHLTPPLPLNLVQAIDLTRWDRTIDAPEFTELTVAIAARLDPTVRLTPAPGPLMRATAIGDWWAAAGCRDGVVRVWDLATGEIARTLAGHGDIATAIDHDRADRLVSGSTDRTARVWRLSTGAELVVLAGHRGPVDDVAFAGGGVVTASADRTVRWWDPDTGRTLHSLPVAAPALACSALGAPEPGADPGAARIVVGDRAGSWYVLDPDRGALVRVDDAHHGTIFATATPAAEGSAPLVVTAGADAVARVWDATDGRLVRTLRGHRGPVLSCATHDGELVVTGSADGTARLWDVASGEQVLVIAGHDGGVPGCALTPSGGTFTTSGTGQTRFLTPTARSAA